MYPEYFGQENKHFLYFEYQIKVDPETLKIDPPRRVALELKPKLKEKLDKMEGKGVISKEPEATHGSIPWLLRLRAMATYECA